MSFSNGLTPAEAERLALLAEECAEVIQVVGKILRHGYASYNPLFEHPDHLTPNSILLNREIGHVFAAVSLMVDEEDVFEGMINEAMADKVRRVRSWLHHQKLPGVPGKG